MAKDMRALKPARLLHGRWTPRRTLGTQARVRRADSLQTGTMHRHGLMSYVLLRLRRLAPYRLPWLETLSLQRLLLHLAQNWRGSVSVLMPRGRGGACRVIHLEIISRRPLYTSTKMQCGGAAVRRGMPPFFSQGAHLVPLRHPSGSSNFFCVVSMNNVPPPPPPLLRVVAPRHNSHRPLCACVIGHCLP